MKNRIFKSFVSLTTQLLAISAVHVLAQQPIGQTTMAKTVFENQEWLDCYFYEADRNDLPHVLLIGDSISAQYFGGVRNGLKGKAYVSRLGSSKAICLPAYFDEIKFVLSRNKYSVIHINNGLHGWGYTENEYGQSLPVLMQLLKTYAPDAKLIWAATTPYRMGPRPFEKFHPNNDRVKVRNKIATDFMYKQQIPINDFYTLMEPHPEFYSDGAHFNNEGSAALAAQATQYITKALEAISSVSTTSSNDTPESKAAIEHNKYEYLNLNVYGADRKDLPRVLLIGYSDGVKDALNGKAYVSVFRSSKEFVQPAYFDEIKLVLSQNKYSVIHFAIANRLLGVSENEYEQSLAKLVQLLKTYAPDAKLIWATATPLRSGPPLFEKFHSDNDRVKARNKMTVSLLSKQHFLIDDFYTLMEAHPEFYNKPEEEKAVLVPQIAQCIAQALESK